ncbi:MAG: glutamine amidotransferase [Nanoarchaeota archaeon]
MAKPMTLNICHLYPDLMDTYGDRGNILTIQYRCKQRGIKVIYSPLTINDKLLANYDLYFFGGGQDQAQCIVEHDLAKKSAALRQAVDRGAVLLSICGGYQLLQKYFVTTEGKEIPGIGLFNAFTEASETRMMNNLLIEINPKLLSNIQKTYQSTMNHEPRTMNHLIGFENHSGKTYLEEGTMPMGKVLKGSGNNGQDKTEGAVYKNAFGCYLHGSLLPKNPHFADLLISKALEKNYGKIKLKPLDDSIEWQAHNSAISIIR